MYVTCFIIVICKNQRRQTTLLVLYNLFCKTDHRYVQLRGDMYKLLCIILRICILLFAGGGKRIRYSISSGDPYSYFVIDSYSGDIKTASNLDHEKHSSVLLNVQAMTNEPSSYGHCQVKTMGPIFCLQ